MVNVAHRHGIVVQCQRLVVSIVSALCGLAVKIKRYTDQYIIDDLQMNLCFILRQHAFLVEVDNQCMQVFQHMFVFPQALAVEFQRVA